MITGQRDRRPRGPKDQRPKRQEAEQKRDRVTAIPGDDDPKRPAESQWNRTLNSAFGVSPHGFVFLVTSQLVLRSSPIGLCKGDSLSLKLSSSLSFWFMNLVIWFLAIQYQSVNSDHYYIDRSITILMNNISITVLTSSLLIPLTLLILLIPYTVVRSK